MAIVWEIGNACTAALDGKIYDDELSSFRVIIFVGGWNTVGVLRSVESFDPATHAWKTLSSLPLAVSDHGLVAYGNNCMFLAGGEFPDKLASRFGCCCWCCFCFCLSMLSLLLLLWI